MSGPKCSRYRIGSSFYDLRAQERQRERNRQQSEIRTKILSARKLMDDVKQKHGNQAEYIENLVDTWINQVEIDMSGDLRLAFRGVNGIENYIRNQVPYLERQLAIKNAIREKERIEEEKKRESEMKKFMADQRMRYFDDLKELYPDLFSPAIEQRIKLLKDALTANPENEDTLEKMHEFKIRFGKIVEDYELEIARSKFVKNSLSEIIGSNGDDEGSSNLSGTFEGVPITIILDHKDDHLTFEFPEDGDCKANIALIRQHLHNAGIELGPVRIVQTGEVLQFSTHDNNEAHRIKA